MSSRTLALARAAALAFTAITAHAAGAAERTAPAPLLSAGDVAAAKGSLFAIIYRPGPAWREGVAMRDQGLGPHARYMQELLDGGRLVAGGGFADDDGGMAIVRAAGLEAAKAILAADPAVTSGIFVGEIEEWRIRFHETDCCSAVSGADRIIDWPN
jgi:uncharacterized protein YciI